MDSAKATRINLRSGFSFRRPKKVADKMTGRQRSAGFTDRYPKSMARKGSMARKVVAARLLRIHRSVPKSV